MRESTWRSCRRGVSPECRYTTVTPEEVLEICGHVSRPPHPVLQHGPAISYQQHESQLQASAGSLQGNGLQGSRRVRAEPVLRRPAEHELLRAGGGGGAAAHFSYGPTARRLLRVRRRSWASSPGDRAQGVPEIDLSGALAALLGGDQHRRRSGRQARRLIRRAR